MMVFLLALGLGGCGSDSTTTTAGSTGTLEVKNAALPVATNTTGYATTLGATGGKGPYVWSTVEGAGTLPPGLTLAADGKITGTPNAVGTYSLVFKVKDSSTPAIEGQKLLTINVSTLTFTPGTTGAGLYNDHCAWCHFPIGSANQQFIGATFAQIKAAVEADKGGMGEFSSSGVIPLTDTELNLIAGAMAAPVAYITPTFTTTTLPAATVGAAYSQTLSAKDGTPPYKWSTMGGDPIPAGLSLNFNTGVLSGTPTTPGIYNVTFMLEDANPNTMVHQDITVTVNAAVTTPNGTALYGSLCAGCHGPLVTSTKKGKSATTIQNAINTISFHNTTAIKALTVDEITAIATALQ